MKFYCTALFCCLFIFIFMPTHSYTAEPTLAITAQMGSSFATIDVKVTLHSQKNPSIYYLALTHNEKNDPSAETIIAGSSGYWIASGQYTGRIFSLSGGENIKGAYGDKAFIDGQSYDIFMVAVDEKGDYSNVASARDVMAMPFGGISRDKVFIIHAMDKGPQGRQLANIGRLGGEFLEYSYILASDINMNQHPDWTPIDFSGNFDGQNHRIYNLTGSLFGTLEGTLIQNLHVEGRTKTYQDHPIGGLANIAIGSVFKDCHVNMEVEGKNQVGGFVGALLEDAILVNCHAYGDVYGERIVGGFVGAAKGVELSQNASHNIKIAGCHATGNVEAKTGVAGGFAGSLAYAAADAASASGNVYAAGDDVGGFVGRLTHRSRITNACAYGDVKTLGKQVGGFVGIITHGSGIEYAFSTGNIHGTADVGGFAGAIAVPGAPNTLYGCLSLANWIISDSGMGLNRLIGRLDHPGVNNCYAYLGSVVADQDGLRHVHPNLYGADGADVNSQTIEKTLDRLGWKQWGHYPRIIFDNR